MTSNIEDLVKQVETLEDYEAASQALMEIVNREPAKGGQLALNLLRSQAGDVHLRAYAFSMLYAANRVAAFEYVRENSRTCEPGVFGAILGEVAEDVGLLEESAELRQMVAFLQTELLLRSDKTSRAMERGLQLFMKTYGIKSGNA